MLRYIQYKKTKQSGIGLLELMLSLVIIVSLILVATRYFIPTRESFRVNEAINMLRGGINASDAWWNMYKTYMPSKTNVISNQALANVDLLPERFETQKDTINPWSGKFEISAKSATQVQFEMDNIAPKSCRALIGAAQRLNIQVETTEKDCDQDGEGSFKAAYPAPSSSVIPIPPTETGGN